MDNELKIFCKFCIFYVPSEEIHPYDFGPPRHQLEKCLSPENFKDTHVTPDSLPIAQPKTINKFNNCLWFELIDDSETSSSSSEFELESEP